MNKESELQIRLMKAMQINIQEGEKPLDMLVRVLESSARRIGEPETPEPSDKAIKEGGA